VLFGNTSELCIGVDAHCVNGSTRVFINMKLATLFGTQSLPSQGKVSVVYIDSSCLDMTSVNGMRSDLELHYETVWIEGEVI
jgi:hypothetical protein